MAEDRIDVGRGGVARSALAAQYGDGGANLVTRTGVYRYVVGAGDAAFDFPGWVLDHHLWRGEETVADVGCGPGHYVEALAGRARRVAQLDLSPAMVAACRRRRAGAQVVADAARLPLGAASVDVVLAAHMLYHVARIDDALAEARRVLRPGGSLLVALNGVADKAEILSLWQDAGRAVLGAGFDAPNWSARANLDNVPGLAGAHFGSVSVDRLPGRFRFPASDPVLAWVQSLRAGTEDVVADAEWDAVVAELRRRLEERLGREGALVVTKDSGVVVAR